jgi:hypothetical protein
VNPVHEQRSRAEGTAARPRAGVRHRGVPPAEAGGGAARRHLKQLFRDEIKKSYEEYAEQVGQQIAESTPHFQDALNDVLAGGKKVF